MKRFKYLLLLIPLLFISKVNALTFDTFDVTWYYRNKSNESNLLNVTKNQEQKLYAATDEYVNGYITRLETNFIKDAQYYITYELKLFFSPEQELYYRSDTLDRIKNYSYVDSDFKLLNVTTTEEWNRSVSSGPTLLTIKVVMQVIALENTSAVRFGVYTTDNISIGFYSHTEQIDYYLLDNISIDEDINAVIIDKNNQILSGQEELKGDISNSTNTITGEIDDMEQSIVDSNKETQNVIKDQFNDCRDSYNLVDISNTEITKTATYDITNYLSMGKTYSFSVLLSLANNTTDARARLRVDIYDSNNVITYHGGNRLENYNTGISEVENLTIPTDTTKVLLVIQALDVSSFNISVSNVMVNEGSLSKEYEPYGQEVCSNKIDETNNQLGDLNNSLNDSNVDGSLDSAGSFFDSFSTTDHGGLSGIITAPLVAINQMLNTSCSPMTATFKGKELSLPCGYEFWNRLGAIQDFVNIVLGGMLCYRIIIKLYKLIERIKNPEDDRLEVMDL